MKKLSRREFIKKTAKTAAGVSVAQFAGLGEAAKKKMPNVLFVFPDQMRRHAMGFVGEDPVITPNIDRFASEGLYLPNAVSNRPLCSPYRGMLLTGKYPYSNGVLENCWSGSKDSNELGADERCVSDVMKDSGYSLGYIGKWHLDKPHKPYVGEIWDWPGTKYHKSAWDEFTPPDKRHGFDFWYSYGVQNNHFRPHYWINEAARDEDVFIDQWSPEHEVEVASRFIKNKDGKQRDGYKPWCLFISMNPPHNPYDAVPERYKKLYAKKEARELLNRQNVPQDGKANKALKSVNDYFASVTGVDDQFGKLLDCLKEEGLEKDTIVVFTADHGDMMGSHGRMAKSIWYEEALNVPFIIRWPGRIKEGLSDVHLSTPDIMPSLLGLLGLKDVIPDDVEGVDYSGVFLGEREQRPRSGKSSLYIGPGYSRGVRTDRYSYIHGRNEEGEWEKLFDRKKDPYQLTDIANDNKGMINKMREELSFWIQRTNDPW